MYLNSRGQGLRTESPSLSTGAHIVIITPSILTADYCELGATMDEAISALEAGPLEQRLADRADTHATRDYLRDIQEDRSSYVNGVLFGFDPDVPMVDQKEGWRESVTPTADDLADPKKRAARAWSHVERRHQGDD